MTINYRCTDRNNCGTRKTLKKNIDEYIRRPLCPSCGKDTLASVDKKEKERTKKRLCRCDGAPFPHRKGGVPLCRHAQPLDEDEARDYMNKLIRNI